MGFHRVRVALVLLVVAATLAGCIVVPFPWWRQGHGYQHHGPGHGHHHGQGGPYYPRY